MTLVNIKVPIEIKEQLEQMKVHERQATYEIIRMLLDERLIDERLIDDGK